MTDAATIESLLLRAREFVAAKKPLHALQLYQRITTTIPTLEVGWVELAHVCLQLKRTDAANRALQQALSLTRKPAQILYSLAALHREAGNMYEASKYYHRLLATEDGLPRGLRTQLHADLGSVYCERKNIRMAEHHLRTAYRLDARFPRVAEEFAELLLQRGAVAEAMKILLKAHTEEPENGNVRYLLGKAYARKGDWAAALESFAAAIEIDRDDPRGWHMCGATYLAMHRLEESEPYLKKAVALDPRFVDALVDLGLLYVRFGDRNRAKEFFLRALKEEPGNRRARDGQRELQRLRNAQ